MITTMMAAAVRCERRSYLNMSIRMKLLLVVGSFLCVLGSGEARTTHVRVRVHGHTSRAKPALTPEPTATTKAAAAVRDDSAASNGSERERAGINVDALVGACPDKRTLTVRCANSASGRAENGTACVGGGGAGKTKTHPRTGLVYCSNATQVSAAKEDVADQNISDVRSFPEAWMNVDLSKNALEGFHWTESEIPTDNVKITTLNLALNEVKTLANIGAPPNLRSLNVSHNQIVNADMRDLRALETLDCSYNSINSIQAGKSKLSKLYAAKNEFASFAHVTFPDSLAFLDVSGNQLTDWSIFRPPRDLAILNGSNNGITTFPVGNFSAMKQLTTVDFSSNNIEFVVGMLLPDKLTHLDIRGNPIKVIELRATDADKLAKMPSFFVDKGIKQSNCSEHASRKTIGGAEMCVLEDSEYVKLYFPAPSASVEYPAIRVMSVVCFCFFILTGIGVIIGLCVKKRLYDSKRAMEIEHEAQPDALPNDVREDPELVALRVNQHEITNMQKIGQGKFALLFLAKLGERQVVVKQMQMSSVKSRKAVLSYMEEIRISTKLDHPRIIKFIGISWSHLYDLSILVEYAEHGNLSEHLRSQRGIKTNREEFTWFETHSDLRPKLLLAIDVAEALVYLQSFATPILHKNIRAEHVLLTSSWECKLSGFGYATSVSTSMRGELGSIAWFAPELLTGGKFNEKTEVYSFGVFMSELDMCEKPFIQAVKSTGAAALTNVEIATEVTQHNLRPSFHEDCPSDMLKIAQECLHQDPEMRPNAMKLFYDLRQAYRTRSNSSAPNSNQSNNQEAV